MFVLVAAFAAGASAALADVTQGIEANVDPSKAGRSGELHVILTTGDTQNAKPARPVSELIRLAKGARVDVRAAQTCRATRLREGHRCPSASRVGSGSALLDVRAEGTEQVTGPVVAYNAKPLKDGDEARLLLLVTESQTQARAVIEGRVLDDPSGLFGFALRFDSVPAIQTSTGSQMSLTKLDLRFKARKTQKLNGGGKRVLNYYRNPASCAGSERWYFGAEVTLEGGFPLAVSTPVSCTA